MSLPMETDAFPGLVTGSSDLLGVGVRVLPIPDGVARTMGARGGSDASSPVIAYGYGGMFVEYDDGTCFTTNPITAECGCPDSFIAQVMLVTGPTGYDDRERLLYLCY